MVTNMVTSSGGGVFVVVGTSVGVRVEVEVGVGDEVGVGVGVPTKAITTNEREGLNKIPQINIKVKSTMELKATRRYCGYL